MRLILVFLFSMLLSACTKESSGTATEQNSTRAPATDYERKLVATKVRYEFKHWPAFARPIVAGIFDKLIFELIAAGESATEEQKIACFHRAVAALNDLDQSDHSVIETSEAEQLVDLGNHIAIAAGLDPKKYGDGEGPISAGRNW